MNLARIPAFAAGDAFHVVVETPRGSALKMKYEPEWEAMSISRPLPLGVAYPYDWGFIPSTTGPDGDPVDAMLLWDVGSFPGVVIVCRAIGVLQIEQNRLDRQPLARIRNDRVLAIPMAARREQSVAGVTGLSPRVRQELEHFAMAAGALEGKDVRVVGWGDAASALALLHDSVTAR